MSKEEYGLVTFKTTSFALQGEKMFKDKDIIFKTIPTPREVTHSCGLALLFAFDDVDKVKDMIKEDKLNIDNLYKYIKDRNTRESEAEKIIWQ